MTTNFPVPAPMAEFDPTSCISPRRSSLPDRLRLILLVETGTLASSTAFAD